MAHHGDRMLTDPQKLYALVVLMRLRFHSSSLKALRHNHTFVSICPTMSDLCVVMMREARTISTNSWTSPTPSVLIFPISRETKAPSSSLLRRKVMRHQKRLNRLTRIMPLQRELLEFVSKSHLAGVVERLRWKDVFSAVRQRFPDSRRKIL